MEGEPHFVLGVSRAATWQEVRAAYRMLARRYHPDGTNPDVRRMAAVNAAYDVLEREHRRRGGGERVPVGRDPMPADVVRPQQPPTGSLLWRVNAAQHGESPTLDFGQYAGWRIAEVAEHDPRYLVWLSRHSSGIRFRRAIEVALGSRSEIGRRAAVLG